MMSNKRKIKAMKLYKSTIRFYNEYDYLKKKNRQLNVLDFSKFDNLHYHGVNAVKFAIKKLLIREEDIVLDIGAGIGGPARFLSHITGCRIYAIEIQKDLNDIAKKFTRVLALKNKIKHLNNDFLIKKFKFNYFNHVVCWLSLYHIPNRKDYINKIYNILKFNGNLFIEDFYLKRTPSTKEAMILKDKFFANSLVKKKIFTNDLINNKFKISYSRDMTNDWKKFTLNRLNNFINEQDKIEKIHDHKTIKDLLDFYKLAYNLLNIGLLGGIKLNAIKI